MSELELMVFIYMTLRGWMVGTGTLDISALLINVPFTYQGVTMQGKIEFYQTFLHGLQYNENVPLSIVNVEPADANGKNRVCLNTYPFGNLTLETKYNMDLIYMNFPIYGSGDISIAMEISVPDICFDAISNATGITGIENLKILMTHRHRNVSITGFYNNPEVDELLRDGIDMFSVFLAMWNAYDREGSSCFLSPLLQYAVNAHLGYEPNDFQFNPTECLVKGTPFGDFSKINFKGLMTFIREAVEFFNKYRPT